MRKIVGFFPFLPVLIFILAGCGTRSNQPPVQEAEISPPARGAALGLSIDITSDEILASFDYLHEVDYMLVREARWPDGDGIIGGDRLVIWANSPLRNFALISLSNEIAGENFIFVPGDTFALLNELSPGTGFVINSYISAGTLPLSGITFIDENNVQRYFLLVQDQSDDFEAYRLIEFEAGR